MLTGLGGVAAGIVLFLLVLSITGPRSTEQAARATFKVGKAEDLARTVARDGPLLFPDLLNRSRDIFVQHLGGTDWVAFEARAAGAPRQCTLRWEQDGRRFVDPCDGRIYPPDGAGLVTFPARVDDGRVIVDLSSPTPPPSS